MSTQPCWRCGHELMDPHQVHYCDWASIEPLKNLLTPHATSEHRRGFAHPEEVQFLLVHQVFEVWFHLHIFELRRTIRSVLEGDLVSACNLMERITLLTKLYPRHMALMHTMSPKDFGAFRDQLAPASGAESEASRVIELLSGIMEDSPYVVLGGRTLAFRQMLDQAPLAEDGRPKTRYWTPYLSEVAAEPNLATCFESQRRELGGSADFDRLAELLFEYDVAYWRYRCSHLRAAVRQIGTRPGTGHTSGGGYLQSVADTARFFPGLFPDRWEQVKSHPHPDQ